MTTRACPVCDRTTTQVWCCGIDLTARGEWVMDRARVRAVHVLAMGTKGLTEEIYRMRLAAIGVRSCKELTREQFHRLMAGLRALPNAPKARGEQPSEAIAR